MRKGKWFVIPNINHSYTIFLAEEPFPLIALLVSQESLLSSESLYRVKVLLTLVLNCQSEFWKVNIKALLTKPFWRGFSLKLVFRKQPNHQSTQFVLSNPSTYR